MSITERVFNYVDVIKFIIQHTFNINNDYFYILGEITEQQKERQKTQDFFIVLATEEQQPVVTTPEREILRENEKTYEVFKQKFTQNIKINVLSYQATKPDIAYSVANNCRTSLFAELGQQKNILDHTASIMSVGGIKNLSFLESDAKDQIQRYQFDVKLYYELKTSIETDIKQATLGSPKYYTCK